jgi:hypothetical protein
MNEGFVMNPKFGKGQQVIIRQANVSTPSSRDSTLEKYAGQIGRIINYYWISPEAGKIFYLYTVRFGTGNQEIVLYEDEIKIY